MELPWSLENNPFVESINRLTPTELQQIKAAIRAREVKEFEALNNLTLTPDLISVLEARKQEHSDNPWLSPEQKVHFIRQINTRLGKDDYTGEAPIQ